VITVTHARPDGTPLRAKCECGAVWQADLVEFDLDPVQDLFAFIRDHARRGKYLGPVEIPLRTICRAQSYEVTYVGDRQPPEPAA
jgi:hypothetical protein